ncbi:MAG: hypothetical protein NEA02_13040 [Thermoanaerobaculia bacterium]|nr:hypothetical protein [Thermoanaerobaculia bacterium]
MRIGRTIGFLVLALLGAALVWLGAGSLKAARRERSAEAAWAASFGPLGELATRFPARPTNETASALEGAARTLGIEMRPRGEQPDDEMSLRKKSGWDGVRAPLEKWVDTQAAKTEGLPEPPPAPVASFLATHAPALDAIEKALLTGPAPEWAVDVSKLHAAPVPNLQGQMQLARVLVGRAEARAAAKDARVEEPLRAAFALTGSLRGRPELVSQLVSIGMTRLEIAAARRIPVDATAWRERLKTLDPRAGMLLAWKREAWVQHEAAKRLREGQLRAGPLSGRAAVLLRSWRDRLASAAYLDAWRAAIEAAAKSAVEDAETKGLTEAFQAALVQGGARALPPEAMPNLVGSWRRANVLAVEIRKTDLILAARMPKP